MIFSMNSIFKIAVHHALAIGIGLSFAINFASAGTLLNDTLNGFEPLTSEEMAALRGGFITADGIEISIGYEQAAFINGVLQTKLALDISQLARRGDIAVPPGSIAPVKIIQTGETSMAASQPSLNPGYLTLIQNSLDHQTLSNFSVLNIDIKNLPSVSSGSFGNLINNQILNSLH